MKLIIWLSFTVNMMKHKVMALLVIVILLSAAGVSFLFAGLFNLAWKYAHHLNAEDVSGSTWHYSDERPLGKDEIAGLVPLLNQLEKDDFKEDRSLEGLPPQYGIILYGDTTIHISQSDAPEGALAMLYNGRKWWIDNDALAIYIYELCQQQTGGITNPDL